MTDTERLNLIEHYKWEIACTGETSIWTVVLHLSDGVKFADGNNIREAIDAALAAQIKWSLG